MPQTSPCHPGDDATRTLGANEGKLQLTAPVMMKLTAPPRTARPVSKMATDNSGRLTKRNENR